MHMILLFTGSNLGISLIKLIFTYLRNILDRKASNKIQFDYMRDGVIVNYHWAQDGSVLDMKNKSMGANPVFAFWHIGDFVNYIVQFSGVLFVFSILSPLFILMITITSAISIILTFKIRNKLHDFPTPLHHYLHLKVI